MELPLSPPRALLTCSSTPIVFGLRSHSHPAAPTRRAWPLQARRNKNNRSEEDAAIAEPKIITLGRPGKSRRRRNKKQKQPSQKEEGADGDGDDEDEDEDEEDERDATIPEVVTNRMMRRVGLSVGAPLALGVGFFPLFYYLKAVRKVDVPTWIPFGVSFVFFGAALLGVSYGIVSASWDPAREGSLLGWNEARRNWPVFWDSLRGRSPPRRG
ncbi:unnamed protein product [Urochloa decumbens]|uniref:Protein PAM68, chloroplastic n=1 Tax=Urochloa decumbens TaxID=240449 RepID=A0ABC8WP28_9POAL